MSRADWATVGRLFKPDENARLDHFGAWKNILENTDKNALERKLKFLKSTVSNWFGKLIQTEVCFVFRAFIIHSRTTIIV